MKNQKFRHNKNLKTVSFLFLTQYFFSLSLWWAAGDDDGKHTFFLFSLAVFLHQNLCVIYPRGRSVHSCSKNYIKTYVVLSSIHCGIIKILKFNFLTQNFSLSLCVVGPQVMGKTYKNFSLSLSLSLQNLLCNLPSQRKVVSTQLQTGYNGSQQLTTGPNGLKRVPSQRVPTGSNGGRGGEERSMTRLLSPHNYIIYIIYPKKFYFSIHISSLSLSPIIHENIYI